MTEGTGFIIVDHNGTVLDLMRKISIGFVRAVLIGFNLMYVIPTHMFWMILLQPLRIVCPDVYWQIEGTSFSWLLLLVGNWLWTAGYLVCEVGDDVIPLVNDPSLVIVNHQSTADVPTLMYCLCVKKNVSNNIMWIQDMIFKYTNFGWVSLVHGDFFIQQGRAQRNTQLEKLKEHIRNIYIPRKRSWIVLFPEGGFLRKRREKSQKYGKQYGYPILEHVTLPRIGAQKTILKMLSPADQWQNGGTHKDATGKPLKWLIDITIGYPENKTLNLQTIIAGTRKPCHTTFHFRKFPIAELPLDTESLTQWMYRRFQEKDIMLDCFYKHGKFPSWCSDTCKIDTSDLLEPKLVPLPDGKIWTLNVMYLILAFTAWKALINPVFVFSTGIMSITNLC